MKVGRQMQNGAASSIPNSRRGENYKKPHFLIYAISFMKAESLKLQVGVRGIEAKASGLKTEIIILRVELPETEFP